MSISSYASISALSLSFLSLLISFFDSRTSLFLLVDVQSVSDDPKMHIRIIQDIIHDRRKVTADTFLRLARFFGTSDKYFLDIQNDIDIRQLKSEHGSEISDIHPYNAAVV